MKTGREKLSVGERIVAGLKEFTEDLEAGKDITKLYKCHYVNFDFKPSQYGPRLVKQTRKTLHLSQSLFAKFLGVSANTVRGWEQGVNVPSQIACRFMDEIRRDPDYWRSRFRKLATAETAG